MVVEEIFIFSSNHVGVYDLFLVWYVFTRNAPMGTNSSFSQQGYGPSGNKLSWFHWYALSTLWESTIPFAAVILPLVDGYSGSSDEAI